MMSSEDLEEAKHESEVNSPLLSHVPSNSTLL